MFRLIDVALNILMAFIAVSRLKTDHIELPSGSDLNQSVRNVREMTVRIFKDAFEIEERGRRISLQTLPELEASLANLQLDSQQGGQTLTVNISTQRATIIQKLVDVLDICERHKIQKNLNYDSFN
ncbi:MAG: biopolymer transporter ExbD [candidate division KSB1 bacterium]|nr:biopolymer transporter ExbD [candidate division KSB1 bacterium]MDZ7303049.1 biopolymer transporter ExbD [candidate division KSB1 bacterium]MDZ7312443.1 biopolymer transporter ExbD [candidate division KSB1 bacterium]